MPLVEQKDYFTKQHETPGRTAASTLAMMLVQRSLDKGEPLIIPSHHIVFAKVNDAFTENPGTPEEVAEGFRVAFPNSPISSSPKNKPNVVTVTYREAEGNRNWSRKAYVAVNTTGSAPHTNSGEERYLVVRGNLIVTIPRSRRKPPEEHILQPAEEYTIEQGVIHAVSASEGWTIFQATSYPQSNTENQPGPFKRLFQKFTA